MAQISISDATLASMGLSRSQALELLAGALFPDAGQAVNLIIPVINPGTTSAGLGTRPLCYQLSV